MDAEEFAKAMTFLGVAYNKEFTQEQLGVWYIFFRDVTFEDFRKAITRLIVRSKFLPSIAEIRSEITDMANPDLQKSAEEGWADVKRAIQMYGYSRQDEAMKSLNSFTADVVRRVGGFRAICEAEDEWKRKDFIRMYDAMAERARNELSYMEGQRTQIERGHVSMLLEVKDD